MPLGLDPTGLARSVPGRQKDLLIPVITGDGRNEQFKDKYN